MKEPIEIKIDKLKIDETQKGRKTRSKKVSENDLLYNHLVIL